MRRLIDLIRGLGATQPPGVLAVLQSISEKLTAIDVRLHTVGDQLASNTDAIALQHRCIISMDANLDVIRNDQQAIRKHLTLLEQSIAARVKAAAENGRAKAAENDSPHDRAAQIQALRKIVR